MKNNSYTLAVKDKRVTFTHIGASALPAFKNVTSVSVIPFTKEGQVVAVRLRHRGLDIPGGHVEPDETGPKQTLEREVREEACMTVQEPVLVEVIRSDFFEQPSYMLIYTAFVDELYEFSTPEDEMSDGREIVSPQDFIEQYEAGHKDLMSETIKIAWRELNRGE